MAIETMVGNDILLYVDVSQPPKASLSIGTGNSGVRYTADQGGTGGNNVRVAHINPNQANAALAVSVSGNDITVTLGNSGVAGTINSTAEQVRAAVQAHAGASALVDATLLGDGTGTATAAAMAALTGGAAAGTPDYQMVGYQRDISREQNRELIDASHKGSDHAQSVYGRMESTVSLDALVPSPAVGAVATHDALWNAQKEKRPFLVRYIKKGGFGGTDTVYQAEALIGSVSEEGPDNDVATLSLELTLQGPLNKI